MWGEIWNNIRKGLRQRALLRYRKLEIPVQMTIKSYLSSKNYIQSFPGNMLIVSNYTARPEMNLSKIRNNLLMPYSKKKKRYDNKLFIQSLCFRSLSRHIYFFPSTFLSLQMLCTIWFIACSKKSLSRL